jgi:hypothetical protein
LTYEEIIELNSNLWMPYHQQRLDKIVGEKRTKRRGSPE